MEKTANLIFKRYIVNKSVLNIFSDNVSNEFNINFDKIVQNKQEDSFELNVETTIKDSTGNLFINVSIIGFFEFIGDLSDIDKENFIKYNGPSIIFPFIRSHITTLSSLSGLQNIIVIPLLNLSSID